jgi:hypothetical protein
MCHLITVNDLCDFVGISVSVPENIPSSAFIYAILSRDPDVEQEVEVSLSLSFMISPLFKKWNALLSFQ